MGLLTEKYKAWTKHSQNYTAEQVLNQIVADLEWLDEEQAKNCSIPMTKILKSSFKNINTEEVKTFLKNQITDVSKSYSFKLERPSAPELWFYDENDIEAGFYDFEIDGLTFQKCWIEPFDKIEDKPIRYRSGSYYVFKTT